jgi:hypothetical protein
MMDNAAKNRRRAASKPSGVASRGTQEPKLVTLQPDSKVEDRLSSMEVMLQAMKERVQDMESMSDLPSLSAQGSSSAQLPSLS